MRVGSLSSPEDRLGNLVSEFLVVLGRFVAIWGAREGGDFLAAPAPVCEEGDGSALRNITEPYQAAKRHSNTHYVPRARWRIFVVGPL